MTNKSEKTEMSKTKNLQVVDKKQPTVEDLQRQVETLKKQLEAKPKSLEDQIVYFELKKEKIEHLRKFELSKEKINVALKEVVNIVDNADFDNTNFRLLLNDHRSYKETPIFAISNPVIIRQAMEFIGNEIDLRIAKLETEIAK